MSCIGPRGPDGADAPALYRIQRDIVVNSNMTLSSNITDNTVFYLYPDSPNLTVTLPTDPQNNNTIIAVKNSSDTFSITVNGISLSNGETSSFIFINNSIGWVRIYL